MRTLDNEVRSRLYGILDGTSSIEEFEAWFVGRTWDERTLLIARIDHLFAERALMDEEALTQELRALTETIAEADAGVTTTWSTTVTVRPQVIHVGGTETIRGRLEVAGR